MTRIAVALSLAVIAAGAVHGQETGGLRFIAPVSNGYVSGPITLLVVYEGGGGNDAVQDVTFFADGKQICGPAWRFRCDWDAGPGVTAHTFRVSATLKAGGRVVANLRTQALAFAQSERVDIVQANAVVKEGGRFVKGLTRESFALLDNQQPRRITDVTSGGQLELLLALDVSESMEPALPQLRSAVRAFLAAIGSGHQVTITAFNDSVFTVARSDLSVEARARELDSLTAWGTTALYDAIAESLQKLNGRGRKALVVFSDGADTRSSTSYSDVRRLLDESDATVFTIGVGLSQETADRELRVRLEELADASGGLALFADDTDRLASSFAEIVETLANQYTLSFEPQRDGRYHPLTVQVPGRNARVRARRGYVAPKE